MAYMVRTSFAFVRRPQQIRPTCSWDLRFCYAIHQQSSRAQKHYRGNIVSKYIWISIIKIYIPRAGLLELLGRRNTLLLTFFLQRVVGLLQASNALLLSSNNALMSSHFALSIHTTSLFLAELFLDLLQTSFNLNSLFFLRVLKLLY